MGSKGCSSPCHAASQTPTQECPSLWNAEVGTAPRGIRTRQDAVREDIRYNLAGVYAMRGDRDRLLAEVRQLKGSYHEISNIRAHLNTYFANFAEDGEFLRALGMHQP